MGRVVVTGGAGFIGSNLCEALREQGHAVTAVDNLSASDANVDHLRQIGVELLVADIASYDEIEEAFAGADTVFHLAAMNRAQRSIEDPIGAHHSNITGTLHVLEAMRKHRVPLIVFASSSSVYAGRSGLLHEETPVAPPHPYGVGKLSGEHYVRIYGELFGVDWVTLRFFSVYGPRQLGHIDKAGVVAKFIHQARKGEPLSIFGDGSNRRNFTYVQDVVRSCLLASEREQARGHIINIANPDEIAVAELARLVTELVPGADVEHHPLPRGDPARNPADVSKAARLLGYTPKVSFEEGLLRTLEWYDETREIRSSK